jgi:hypothetical protein
MWWVFGFGLKTEYDTSAVVAQPPHYPSRSGEPRNGIAILSSPPSTLVGELSSPGAADRGSRPMDGVHGIFFKKYSLLQFSHESYKKVPKLFGNQATVQKIHSQAPRFWKIFIERSLA